MAGYDAAVKSNCMGVARPPPATLSGQFLSLSLSISLSLSLLSFLPKMTSVTLLQKPRLLKVRFTLVPYMTAWSPMGGVVPTTHDRLSPADVMMHGDGDGKAQSRAQRWHWCLRVESRSAELPTISDTDWCGHLVEGGHHAATPEQVRRRDRAAWLSASIYNAFAMVAGRASRSGRETADHAAMALYF